MAHDRAIQRLIAGIIAFSWQNYVRGLCLSVSQQSRSTVSSIASTNIVQTTNKCVATAVDYH